MKLGKRKYVFIYILLGFCIFLLLKAFIKTIADDRGNSLPSIRIGLNDVILDEVHNNENSIKYFGNNLEVDYKGKTFKYGNVEFKGRGNASWLMDKKSYRIKFSNRVDFLNFGKVKKLGLISNNLDDSLMRNDLAHYIARIINDNHPIEGDFINLFIDGEDLGLYYLIKLIEIDKNSFDLRDPEGVIVELDNAYCMAEEKWVITKEMGDCLSLKDSVSKDETIKEEAFLSFIDNYNGFEEAVYAGNFEMAQKYVDMESLAKQYLLNEFVSNFDEFITSQFFYKNGKSDIMHAVTAWDYDAAFGNKKWGIVDDELYNPNVLMARARFLFEEKEDYVAEGGDCRFIFEGDPVAMQYVSLMFCYLVDMPEFRELVSDLYKEKLMNRREDIINYIKDTAKYIREEAIRDNEKWGKGNFDEEVKYLIWWVEGRFDFFDKICGERIIDLESRASEI